MSIGSAAKLAIEDSNGESPETFNASSERYDFLYETMTKKQRRVGNRTIKGDLSDWEERSVEGSSLCSGVVAFNASPAWFSKWIPRVIGTETNGNNADGDAIYEPGVSLPRFDMLIYKEAKTFHFYDCYVNRCVLRGQSAPGEEEPEAITAVVQLIAKDRVTTTSWPAPEPALGTTMNALPDVMGLTDLSIGGTDYPFDAFVLSIDHSLIVKWRNSLTVSCIRPGMRKVRLQLNSPFLTASFDALHETLASRPAGLMKFNRPGSVEDSYTELNFGALDNVGDDPQVRGKTEIPHVFEFNCLKDATTPVPEITGETHLGT
jgi:hypothetical protein